MAQRLIEPLAQVLDDAGQPRSGARLFFYESGTSNKANTYSDAALTTPNANPLILNEYGQPATDVFGQNIDYKMVLAGTDAAGTDDPPTNIIRTFDPVRTSDFKSFFKAWTGSGNPNGSVAGTAGSAGVLPDTYWDYTNLVLYYCTTTGNAAAAVWTAINASASTPSVPTPQGRLTPTSGTPVISSGVISGTDVYYTPFTGNLIPIYNGSTMVPMECSELTLSLVASHAANTIYDVFVFSNSGVMTLVTGPAWASSVAGSSSRGSGASTTELTRVKGLWVNSVQMTARNGSTTHTIGANLATYVGSIFIDSAAGQVSCHTAWGQSRKWGIWNAFNRKPISLYVGDSTASWANTSGSVRTANGSSLNVCTIFAGLAEEEFRITNTQLMALAPNPSSAVHEFVRNGIGLNSTGVFSGTRGQVGANAIANGTIQTWVEATATAVCDAAPSLGIGNIYALEQGNASASVAVLFYGTQSSFCMTARWTG